MEGERRGENEWGHKERKPRGEREERRGKEKRKRASSSSEEGQMGRESGWRGVGRCNCLVLAGQKGVGRACLIKGQSTQVRGHASRLQHKYFCH